MIFNLNSCEYRSNDGRIRRMKREDMISLARCKFKYINGIKGDHND